jgi:hypothetical protein
MALLKFDDGMCDCIICPKCECMYTHQLEVISEFRKEDRDAIAVTHSLDGIDLNTVKKENVAGRRDNIYIKFNCEYGCLFTMRIQQNKGYTHLLYVLEDRSAIL